MDRTMYQRAEERLHYRWPVWFGEDTALAGFLGLMVDVSSGGLAFTCPVDRCCFQEGQRLTVRFDIPQFGRPDDPQAMVGVTRTGCVRSAVIQGDRYRIGLQFDQPLSLKPSDEAKLAALCHASTQP